MNAIPQQNDLYSLSLDHNEATYLDHEKLIERQERVQRARDPEGLANLRIMVDEYIAGRRELTAIDFYLEFEQASLLILFHTLPRRGERNKHANGLQQTYGDHIRLLMLGFDMYDEGNIDWVMSRRWHDPADVDRPELEASLQSYKDLKLTRSEKVAMWIASALHDYGKIFRRGYGLDAEDAAPLCQELVETLAPPEMQELVQYGVRNHDLIEHTVTGDTPTHFITEPIEVLPFEVRSRAMPMLALIQLIGAASLGEGRITKAKLAIYNSCLDGSIVAESGISTRLGRLLFGGLAVPDASATSRAGEQLAKMDDADRATLTTLMEKTVLHGWSAVREQILDQENDEAKALPRLIQTLVLVSRLWRESSPAPTHVVMARPHELAKCTGPNGDNGARLNNEDTSTQLLNGAVALILR